MSGYEEVRQSTFGAPRLVKVKKCLCGDGHRRTVEVTGEADTWWTVPAKTKVTTPEGRRTVRGYLTHSDLYNELVFIADVEHRMMLPGIEPVEGLSWVACGAPFATEGYDYVSYLSVARERVKVGSASVPAGTFVDYVWSGGGYVMHVLPHEDVLAALVLWSRETEGRYEDLYARATSEETAQYAHRMVGICRELRERLLAVCSVEAAG